MVLVSVDDHVVEPPRLVRRPAPREVRRPGPANSSPVRTARTPGCTRATRSPTSRSTPSPAGLRRSTAWNRPRSTEIRTGTWDIDERIKDMDANGILGSLCFPSFPQFCGQLFARTEDKDVALAMVQAYNNWHIEEWCGAHPGRFIPCPLPAIWDPQVLADEVRRTAQDGRPRGDLLGEPLQARLAQLPHRPLGPVLAGLQRGAGRRVHAHRLVVQHADDRAGRADRRDDHAARRSTSCSAPPTSSGPRCCASSRT